MRPEEAASWGELARRMCPHAWGVRRDRAFADGAYSRVSGPGFSSERPQRAPRVARERPLQRRTSRIPREPVTIPVHCGALAKRGRSNEEPECEPTVLSTSVVRFWCSSGGFVRSSGSCRGS